jgi:hypothetical protein
MTETMYKEILERNLFDSAKKLGLSGSILIMHDNKKNSSCKAIDNNRGFILEHCYNIIILNRLQVYGPLVR